MPYLINLENGKYTLKNDNGLVSCLRHGEEWQPNITGKLMLTLMHSHEDQAEEIKELRLKILSLIKESSKSNLQIMYPSAIDPDAVDLLQEGFGLGKDL